MTVPELLATSRAAHLRYRKASDARDHAGALRELTAAFDALESALELDPTRSDAAWPANAEALQVFYQGYIARRSS